MKKKQFKQNEITDETIEFYSTGQSYDLVWKGLSANYGDIANHTYPFSSQLQKKGIIEYTMHMELNKSETEVALANTDRSLQLLDLANGVPRQILRFAPEAQHTKKIESLQFTDINVGGVIPDKQGFQSMLLTASEDKTVKLWDRNSGQLALETKYGNLPFYSAATNGQVIVGGTNRDLVFWDIRKIKNPLDVLETHN